MEIWSEIKELMPYIVAIASGVGSYYAACKSARAEMDKIKENNKHELERLMQQHKVDIDSLEKAHQLELEKMKLTYQHELKMKETETGMQIGTMLLSETIKLPEVRAQLGQSVRKGNKRKK